VLLAAEAPGCAERFSISKKTVSRYIPGMVERLDITELTPAERLELIGRLWDSLEPEDVRLTLRQDAELGRRMATFDADAKAAVPWEEIEADLLRRSR
jgi:putative addiction module component (TIGR02574 family)